MNAISKRHLPPGIHLNVAEHIYHADPAETPSASASILRKIIDQSPAHAWAAHPRLNPYFTSSPSTEAQATGTIMHAMILGQPDPYQIIEADDFRTKAAKDMRDAAIFAGKIPILAHKLEPLSNLAMRVREHIERKYPEVHAALNDPETAKEATVIGHLNGVLCRTRYDMLPPKRYGFSVDLKFTGTDDGAEPGAWSRKSAPRYMVQGNLYPRLLKTVRGDAPEFRFLSIEVGSVMASSMHALSPAMNDIARNRVNRGLAKWQRCLTTNHWPDYDERVHYSEPSSYMIADDALQTEGYGP